MNILKMWALKRKRRKLVNGLAWLTETNGDNTLINNMTNELQKINDIIDNVEDENDEQYGENIADL